MPRTNLTVPERHQLRIARQTLKMNPAMVGVMGGMTIDEARNIVAEHNGEASYRSLNTPSLGGWAR